MQWVFTYVLYPALLLGIFIFIIGTILVLFHRTDNIRIIVASVLPLVFMVFLVVSDSGYINKMAAYLLDIPVSFHLISGIFAGILAIEAGNLAGRARSPIAEALFCLFLSAIGTFILFCIMTGVIKSIHTLLFGMVIAGGLHSIFRGVPGMHPD